MIWIHRWLVRNVRNSLLSALIVALLALIVCVLLTTLLMDTLNLPQILFDLLIYSSHVAAVFAAVVHTVYRRKKRGMFHGIRISVMYLLVFWLVNFIASDHSFSWDEVTIFLLVVVFGGVSGNWAQKKLQSGGKKRG